MTEAQANYKKDMDDVERYRLLVAKDETPAATIRSGGSDGRGR